MALVRAAPPVMPLMFSDVDIGNCPPQPTATCVPAGGDRADLPLFLYVSHSLSVLRADLAR